ncbi:MAG: hypothetical protein PUG67_06050, partial [Peptoniphilaceae bacterium]|nr:hypothetical protein [Peptoniphilaceae bacterium]
MKIRKTEEKDIKEVLDIYKVAQEFMVKNNNPKQWEKNYPSIDTLREDMKKEVSYVIEENGEI